MCIRDRPIFHVTMQAHIEIAIDTDGQLIRGCSRAIEDKGCLLYTSRPKSSFWAAVS